MRGIELNCSQAARHKVMDLIETMGMRLRAEEGNVEVGQVLNDLHARMSQWVYNAEAKLTETGIRFKVSTVADDMLVITHPTQEDVPLFYFYKENGNWEYAEYSKDQLRKGNGIGALIDEYNNCCGHPHGG